MTNLSGSQCLNVFSYPLGLAVMPNQTTINTTISATTQIAQFSQTLINTAAVPIEPVFSGLDLLDDGQLNSSIFQSLGYGAKAATDQALQPACTTTTTQTDAEYDLQQKQLQEQQELEAKQLKERQALEQKQLSEKQQYTNPLGNGFIAQFIMLLLTMMQNLFNSLFGIKDSQSTTAEDTTQECCTETEEAEEAEEAEECNNNQNTYTLPTTQTQVAFDKIPENPATNKVITTPTGTLAINEDGNGFSYSDASNNFSMAYAEEGKYHSLAIAQNTPDGSTAFATTWEDEEVAQTAGEIKINDNVNQIDVSGAKEWGDPHYEVTNKNGEVIQYDHQGVNNGVYNIFEGDNLSIDAKYENIANDNTIKVVGETNIRAGSDEVQFTKEGVATINGQVIENGNYNLADGSALELSDLDGKKTMKMTTNEQDATVTITADGDGGMTVIPEGKFANLDGILGKGILEGGMTVDDAEKFYKGSMV